jgi:small subunit ribosomal protein S20
MAKSQLKSLAKKVREVAAGEDAELRKCSSIAYVSALDKAVKRGIIHKNQANRRKSTVASFIFG